MGAIRSAETLNRECQCSTLDVARLEARVGCRDRPNLFVSSPVFLERIHFDAMRRVVLAMEEVVRQPGYRDTVLAYAPDIAGAVQPHHGVFLGFDFHIAPDGPKLIEINTNAGGAFLNMAARDAQIECCEGAASQGMILPAADDVGRRIMAMFRREWRLARGDEAPLRSVAIVDESPAAQFLYPEFLLAKRMLEEQGIRVVIGDVADLRLHEDRLMLHDQCADMVYNRSTDFYFRSGAHAVLREAHVRDLAVVTPHPRSHALYANKRNLALLSDSATLSKLGIDARLVEDLAAVIPHTREVTGSQEEWWSDRRNWFFKPVHGYGSRGAYRGDKLTRKVMSQIFGGDYVAQRFMPPGQRERELPDGRAALKVDIRCYAYDGDILLTAARLYQGQTTNFRSAGGGFAPVYVVGG